MKFNDVAIFSVKGNNYRIHLWYMSKDDAINIMKTSDLKKQVIIKFFSLYIKMNEITYYKKHGNNTN